MHRLLSLLLLLFTASAADQILALNNRHERTRLPLHFDRNPGQNQSQLEVSVSVQESQTFALLRADSGRFTVRNAGGSGDLSLLFEKGRIHFGMTGGLSPLDQGLPRVGAFMGYGVGLGLVRATVAGGLMLNNTWNEVRYNYVDHDYVWIFPVVTGVREDSTRTLKGRLEIPLQAGLLIETGTTLSPYVGASMNRMFIGTGDGGENVLVRELTAGVEWAVSKRGVVKLEASAAQATIDVGPTLEGETNGRVLPGLSVAYIQRL